MRALALSSIGLAAASCGGGGASTAPIPPAAMRTDLLFGYYGENAMSAAETSPHANLAWCADFYGPAEQMACLTQAKGLGMKVVVMLPAYANGTTLPESELRFWLQRLADAGLLWEGVVALYPIDEPQLDAAVVRAQNATLRRVMADYPALAHAKLAVIYACSKGFPGADSYDVISCDDYDSGSLVMARYYEALQAANPQARLMVVPGGADPWRMPPDVFVAYANETPAVWAIVPFIWQTADGHTGIRENGMRAAYCAAGRALIQSQATCQ